MAYVQSQIRKSALPSNHPHLALSYGHLSLAYMGLKQYEKALEAQKKALSIDEQILPPNSPELISDYNKLTKIYVKMEQYDKAIESQRKVLTMQKEILPPNDADIATSYKNIAFIYEKMKLHKNALQARKEALAIDEQHLAPNDLFLAFSYHNLAANYAITGEPKKAKPLFEKAYNIFKEKKGEGDPTTKDAKQWLEHVNRVLGMQSDNEPEASPLNQKFENSKFDNFLISRKIEEYKTIEINGLTWMAENLNYEVDNSWCYTDNPIFCLVEGRLYTWEAAKEACEKIGWRLPNLDEWKALVEHFGGYYDLSLKKDFGSSLVSYVNLIHTSKDFKVNLSGIRYPNGQFDHVQEIASYWTNSENESGFSWFIFFDAPQGRTVLFYSDKSNGYSCRCVKD